MNYTIENFNLENHSKLLQNVKNNELIFFPENLLEVKNTSEFIYSETTTDIKKIFRANNVSTKYLNDEKPLLRARKSADWFGPIFFIGFTTLSQNPELINISLNLISSYLYDFFKVNHKDKKVKFEIVVENKNKEFQKIKYEGSIEGIKNLEGVIKQLKK